MVLNIAVFAAKRRHHFSEAKLLERSPEEAQPRRSKRLKVRRLASSSSRSKSLEFRPGVQIPLTDGDTSDTTE